MAALEKSEFERDRVTLRLSIDEYERLLLMMGFALGAAMKDNDKALAGMFLKLANRINRDNPNWRPYEVPGEAVPGGEAKRKREGEESAPASKSVKPPFRAD